MNGKEARLRVGSTAWRVADADGDSLPSEMLLRGRHVDRRKWLGPQLGGGSGEQIT
jgi:hypothetical protein